VERRYKCSYWLNQRIQKLGIYVYVKQKALKNLSVSISRGYMSNGKITGESH
jgi:hypothetical protein